MGPLYVSFGETQKAISTYKEAIKVYNRMLGVSNQGTAPAERDKVLNKILYNIAEVQAALVLAYFGNSQFDESLKAYDKSMVVYLHWYGEGTIPKDLSNTIDDIGDILVDMKDVLTESLGEEQYEQIIQSTTSSSSDSGSSSSSSNTGGSGSGSGNSGGGDYLDL